MWYTIFHVKNQHTLTFLKVLPALRDFCSAWVFNLLPKRLNFNLSNPNLFKYFGLRIRNLSYTKLCLCSPTVLTCSFFHTGITVSQQSKKLLTSIKICVILNYFKREKKYKKKKKMKRKSLRTSQQSPWGLKQVFLVDHTNHKVQGLAWKNTLQLSSGAQKGCLPFPSVLDLAHL